ncbi:MAG: M20/M25/M40 family metallo-hydrolase [Thermoanaerobaculia bacterium]|nr:M20/M25/M40 family metallo-hydrolase [Thermoanaerobaculia bacterium]
MLTSIVVGILLAGPLSAAEPVTIEHRIVEAIDARHDEAIELLAELVDINSGSLNLAGVRRVGERLDSELTELGLTTKWIEGASFERAGHLIARSEGRGPKVLLIGHLDTVFEPDSPFQSFERLDADHAKGPGAVDMKGGVVILLEVLRALAAASVLEDLQITVVLTGDEELSGRPLDLARGNLIAAGHEADIALGFEDGDGDPETAVVARRGSTNWSLEVRGIPAHSSQIFTEEVGAGAIYETARILEGFRRELADEEDLTFNPGVILGGTEVDFDHDQARGTGFGKDNVVAEFASVRGDLRATSLEQLVRAEAIMQRVTSESLPGTSAVLTIDHGYPPMGVTEGNSRLLAMYSQASEDLGFGPVTAVDPRRAGAADISFVANDVSMALDGLGLMGTGGHTVEETADLRTLSSQAKRAAVLLYRLSLAHASH